MARTFAPAFRPIATTGFAGLRVTRRAAILLSRHVYWPFLDRSFLA